MSVFPGDVVSTSVGVLHVESVIVERSRAGDSFAVSGVDGGGANAPVDSQSTTGTRFHRYRCPIDDSKDNAQQYAHIHCATGINAYVITIH